MQLVEVWYAYPALFYGSVGVLGALIGSFLNVVIYRLPVMMERDWHRQCAELSGAAPAEHESFNLVSPRSRCRQCGHGIAAWQNIPIVSYVILRGRCRACKTPIGLRYPMVELLTALLSLAVAWRFGVSMQTVAALVLTWGLIAASFIDFDHQLLPDDITLPLLWLGLAVNLAGMFTALPHAVIGAIAGYLFLWLVFHGFKLLTGKEGMGYGDFKLFALAGAWLGWQSLPLVILLASVAGAVIGLSAIGFLGRDRKLPMPFGPFLAIAIWIALLWGDQIVRAYIAFMQPA